MRSGASFMFDARGASAATLEVRRARAVAHCLLRFFTQLQCLFLRHHAASVLLDDVGSGRIDHLGATSALPSGRASRVRPGQRLQPRVLAATPAGGHEPFRRHPDPPVLSGPLFASLMSSFNPSVRVVSADAAGLLIEPHRDIAGFASFGIRRLQPDPPPVSPEHLLLWWLPAARAATMLGNPCFLLSPSALRRRSISRLRS